MVTSDNKMPFQPYFTRVSGKSEKCQILYFPDAFRIRKNVRCLLPAAALPGRKTSPVDEKK